MHAPRPIAEVARCWPLLALAVIACTTPPGSREGSGIADAGIDGGLDAGLSFRCVGALPDAGPVSPSPSLAVDASVVFSVELDGGWLGGELVLASDRLALTSGSNLYWFDRDGGTSGSAQAGPVLDNASSVVAGPNGELFFIGSRVTKFDPQGGVVWTYFFGPNLSASLGPTYATLPTLSPDGTLMVAASDGYLHAINTATGTARWTQAIDLSRGMYPFGPGVGDTFFFGGVPFLVATGEKSEPLPVDAGNAEVRMVSPAGLLTERWAPRRFGAVSEGHVFSFCGAPRWTLPNGTFESWFFELAGFDDAIFVRADIDEMESAGFVYGPDGAVRSGPKTLTASPTVLGADGLAYVVDCGYGTVSAISSSRDVVWSLPLGRTCTRSSAVLSDDGMLYIAKQLQSGQSRSIELIGVQTTSPGLAKTAWPAVRHDNRRTNWFGP